jgi:hypothetical protein
MKTRAELLLADHQLTLIRIALGELLDANSLPQYIENAVVKALNTPMPEPEPVKHRFGGTSVRTEQALSHKAEGLMARAEALGYNVERSTAPHGWEMFSNEKEPGVVRDFMSLNHLERDIEELERHEV